MEFIDDQKRANELLTSLLNAEKSRAHYFDLEADNYHHYNEILCTVQVCAHGDFFLLDAMNLDMSEIFCEVLTKRNIWLHGCDYDLYLLRRHLKIVPQHLYDTQVAARLCGFTKFGYAPLVEQICGVKLPKDSQRADWTKRPLPQKMIAYAKNDVRYLPQLSDVLVDRLAKLKRLDWFEESCAAIVKGSEVNGEEPQRWRINGTGNFKPDSLRYLKSLYFWRDKQAQAIDKPPFKVINNQLLLSWVKDLSEGGEVTLPKSFKGQRRETLFSAIKEAQELPEEEWPERAPRNHGPRVKIDEEALNVLISKRDAVARQLNIESSYIASRKSLEAIVKDEKEAVNLLNWQRELLQL